MNITPTIQEFFKERNVEVVLFPSMQTRKFLEIEDFIDFFQREYAFWINCNNGKLNDIRTHFIQIYNHINNTDTNESNLINILNAAINLAKMNRLPGVYSETVEGKYLKDIFDISSSQASAAYDYIFNYTIRNIQNANNYDNFLGIMRAYNLKDRDNMSENIVNAEKQVLADLRDSYNNKFENLSSEFFSRSETITKEFENVQNKLKEGQEQFSNEAQSLLEDSKQRISELENLYQEKLRLEAPAKYWKNVHKDYNVSGERWKKWSIGLSVIFIIFLTAILYNLPKDLFEPFGFNSVKTTVVFALIASIGIYIIRLLVMLSTSAYHLSRDAYERYQLTYVYLSLLKSNAINDNERSIVLQSIFSRADTGLLKGDSSPAFPGMLEQILKNMKK